MTLSFAILTWNSRDYLERCIGSIRRSLDDTRTSYEVLVLDNGSRDETPSILKRLAAEDPDHIRSFYESANTGTTRSRNRLFAAARGEYLCVMDSDVEVTRGVFEALLPLLRDDTSLGIVAPRVLYPSGKWQKSFDRFPTAISKVNRFFRLRQMEQREARAAGAEVQPFEVDYVISAFWLLRREMVAEIGGLDERIFYSPEDVDFCLRVWQSGRRIVYVPGATVVHHTQEISRGMKLNRAKFSHLYGLIYYFAKHRYALRRPRFHRQDRAL